MKSSSANTCMGCEREFPVRELGIDGLCNDCVIVNWVHAVEDMHTHQWSSDLEDDDEHAS